MVNLPSMEGPEALSVSSKSHKDRAIQLRVPLYWGCSGDMRGKGRKIQDGLD
jgi:hypothetical protein